MDRENEKMEYRGKKLKDIGVTLPLADGTELNCSVYVYFTFYGKEYFALQPLTKEGIPDISMSLMLYEVVEDEESNPVVVYIEDDNEFKLVSDYFAETYLS